VLRLLSVHGHWSVGNQSSSVSYLSVYGWREREWMFQQAKLMSCLSYSTEPVNLYAYTHRQNGCLLQFQIYLNINNLLQ